MSKALYRTYRSKTLDEIVGQEHITAILKRAISKGSIAHAYLLTGPKGVGKTSIARILAHEINGLPYTDETQHLDIIEIDAASNNSVEDVRDLRDKVQIAPTSAQHKVYIIDEVHMLSKQAFNALLKTLEEPPEHIVFILATTDADKLPATILSRVQRFNFRAITEQDAVSHLSAIAKKEKIPIDQDAIEVIAHHGKGSFRDSIGLLDQMRHVSDGTITKDAVVTLLGLADTELIAQLLTAYTAGDITTVVSLLDTTDTLGIQPAIVAEQLIRYIRQDIVHNTAYLPLMSDLLEVPKASWPAIKLLTVLTAHVSTNVPTPPPAPVVAPKKEAAQKPTVAQPVPTKKSTPTPKPIKEQPFAWDDFLHELQVNNITGAYVILRGITHAFDGTTLTLYAGKKFNKAKLEKALPDMSATLSGLGVQAEIVITDTNKPPEDETTAAILDMMGGGEEINAR